ncbi:GNAT family N-acetyltransferase [Phytohabitans rumicis]|uniref:N-acetyltransferase domain-containing protein n=1 Tax=Phytohabitans rumicis TaxID=1076125 RepID=A0A6V8LNS3_9ACTN|nr:GNAT family N-acetyltransferase [Phytohabitans rumicis]GFJ96299.1 hypothetical protein Prum_099410 [Phytohabitans rumicis]
MLVDTISAAAREAAAAAERAAGVRVRELADRAELRAASELLRAIWRPAGGEPLLAPDLMRAMAKAGCYLAGAYDGPALVGVCVGFFHPPADAALHSHVAGVAPHAQGRGIGFALKAHQRAWALERGASTVSWTFDPLVRRNAYFNIARLGAGVAEYLTNFYGPMEDALNRGEESDRVLVRWDLSGTGPAAVADGADPAVALSEGPDGWPVLGRVDAARVRVGVPSSIGALRRDEPGAARAWRAALREVLGGLLAEGAAVTGFHRAGWYMITKPETGPNLG